jgi:hypothetical protein
MNNKGYPCLNIDLKDYRDGYGTPSYIVDAAKRSLGIDRFDIDVASNASYNETVGAKKFYSREDPCPDTLPSDAYIWCNPPGPLKAARVFWEKILKSEVENVAFLLFNVDYLRNWKPPHTLTNWTLCFLHKRVTYVGGKSGAGFASALIVGGYENIDPLEEIGTCFEWY